MKKLIIFGEQMVQSQHSQEKFYRFIVIYTGLYSFWKSSSPSSWTFPDPAPTLSPTSLPVVTQLSYWRKSKNE